MSRPIPRDPADVVSNVRATLFVHPYNVSIVLRTKPSYVLILKGYGYQLSVFQRKDARQHNWVGLNVVVKVIYISKTLPLLTTTIWVTIFLCIVLLNRSCVFEPHSKKLSPNSPVGEIILEHFICRQDCARPKFSATGEFTAWSHNQCDEILDNEIIYQVTIMQLLYKDS